MKKLTVVIVNYNVKYYIEQCLRSVEWALRNIDSDIIVVDNHSHDGSVEYLSERFPNVHVVSSNHNLGFSRANNHAIRMSSSEYVLLLNPDTIVEENTIEHCVQFMDDHPKAGGLGLRMLRTDGSNAMESRRGIPTPATAFYKMAGLCSRYPDHPRFAHYYMSNMPWDKAGQIEVISGAFCMLRRKALDQVGLLDEDYFMYGEDVDLSYRLLQGGWENWYLPERILHYKGESTHKSSFRYVHVFYDAMLIFFNKHFSNYGFFMSVPIRIAVIVKAIIALITLTWYDWREKVGMKDRGSMQQPHYVFIGSTNSLAQCRKIATNKGLEAEFIEGTCGTMPEGHLTLKLPENGNVIVVYDVHTYSYSQIFDIFSKTPNPRITIGTYSNDSRCVLTADEVIFDYHNENSGQKQ